MFGGHLSISAPQPFSAFPLDEVICCPVKRSLQILTNASFHPFLAQGEAPIGKTRMAVSSCTERH